MTEIPRSHPRYESLVAREMVAAGVKEGITSTQGLIAQGRGEAFDYLLGEKTTPSAMTATKTAAAALLLAKLPVLSVNGNVAALGADPMVKLAEALDCQLEVNLFHRTEDRVKKIADKLRLCGATKVIGEHPDATVPGIDHSRSKATRGGIIDADVVLIPLEDGDRCIALRNMGKTIIAIDLNPLARSSKEANITIVDNLVRAVPNLTAAVNDLKSASPSDLKAILDEYNNLQVLRDAHERMIEVLKEQI